MENQRLKDLLKRVHQRPTKRIHNLLSDRFYRKEGARYLSSTEGR
jgi:hypothetical protein